MSKYFSYHADWVQKFSSAQSREELSHQAEEAILVRQAICRELSEAQEYGIWTRPQCDEWYAQYRVSLGKENISFCDNWERLKTH